MGKTISSVQELQALPAETVVHTGKFARTKTHDADEWDMVMDAEEVLAEGSGSVLVIYEP